MDAISFRQARSGDAGALGRLHAECWRESYTGLLPDHLLESLSAEARSSMWKVVLNDPATSGATTVFVAESQNVMVGFAACGSQRDQALAEAGFDGEIGAIYIRRSHQGAGVGTFLMNLMSRKLLAGGRRTVALWVLRENVAARNFYERLGGAVVAERQVEESGATLAEVAFGWSDLSALAGRPSG